MSKFRKKKIYERLILGKNAPIHIVYAYGVLLSRTNRFNLSEQGSKKNSPQVSQNLTDGTNEKNLK